MYGITSGRYMRLNDILTNDSLFLAESTLLTLNEGVADTIRLLFSDFKKLTQILSSKNTNDKQHLRSVWRQKAINAIKVAKGKYSAASNRFDELFDLIHGIDRDAEFFNNHQLNPQESNKGSLEFELIYFMAVSAIDEIFGEYEEDPKQVETWLMKLISAIKTSINSDASKPAFIWSQLFSLFKYLKKSKPHPSLVSSDGFPQ